MKMSFFYKATIVAGLLWSSTVICGLAQTASHSCPDYISPGTLTVSCQFARPVGTTNLELLCVLTLPDGWVVNEEGLIGQGGPALDIDGKTILFTGSLTANPLSFSYEVIVPSEQSGPQEIVADFYYRLRGESMKVIRATPDPLVIDDSLRTLQVISAYGTATPAVGVHTNLSGSVLTASVSEYATLGATQYVCTGWAMTGNAPASGTTNSLTMTHTADAVLTWNWAIDNISPSVEGEVKMTGWRTRANVLPEENLLSHASDPDGDTVTLTSVDTTSAYGGTITRLNGVLTYTPPKHTDAVLDSFTYTVEDGRGGSAKGVVNIKVYYGGSAIRVF